MAVLGTGESHGGCSILHAAGLGYGCSLALDLPVKVKLLDKASKKGLNDPDDLLQSVANIWESSELTQGFEEYHWSISSSIPPRQGLKSSAAICVAAFRALADAEGINMEIHQIVHMAALAQVDAGVSLTGSIDDAWAAADEGWKLIDINAETIQSGVLLESPGPQSDEWAVLIVIRGDRESRPQLEDFSFHQQAFAQSLNALQEGNDLVALTWNGRGVVGALNDPLGRKLTNDAFVNGARAAGISGSGTAIVIFVPAKNEPTLNRLREFYTKLNKFELIETTVLNKKIE